MGIEVKNLIKSFDKKVILDDISFKVDTINKVPEEPIKQF